MEVLGDEAQVEARFGPFGDSANLDEVHGLRRTYHRLGNLILVYLETVLVYVQDSWTVSAKRTIRSEIELDAPDHTPR
jgi:hypothetical protein